MEIRGPRRRGNPGVEVIIDTSDVDINEFYINSLQLYSEVKIKCFFFVSVSVQNCVIKLKITFICVFHSSQRD